MRETPTLVGKKTVLFPFDQALDLDFFVDLHQQYANEMGQYGIGGDINGWIAQLLKLYHGGALMIWTAATNDGKATRKAGFVYLGEMREGHDASIQGLYDPSLVKVPRPRKGKTPISHAEEAMGLVIAHAFDQMRLLRLEADTLVDNKTARQILERTGFQLEGIMRKKAKVHDQAYDVAIYARIVEPKESPNGQVQQPKDRIPSTTRTATSGELCQSAGGTAVRSGV